MSESLPISPTPDDVNLPAQEAVPPSGQSTEIHWEVVAQTSGLTQAHILAGRLEVEGIPVRAWQEGAGQALGLTVGLLGTGYVAVPEEFVEQAQAILMDNDLDSFLEEEE